MYIYKCMNTYMVITKCPKILSNIENISHFSCLCSKMDIFIFYYKSKYAAEKMSKNVCQKNANISIFFDLCSKMDIFIFKYKCKHGVKKMSIKKITEKNVQKWVGHNFTYLD